MFPSMPSGVGGFFCYNIRILGNLDVKSPDWMRVVKDFSNFFALKKMDNFPEWILVVTPILLFVAIGIIIMIALPEKFLENALKETGDDGKKSTSRLVLFISGIMSLAFATCITSFYIYKLICENDTTKVDLDPLVNALLALGIGVIPYTINQVKGMIKG